jgi:hypothetical protein
MIPDQGGEMVRHKTGIGNMENTYKTLVGNTEGKVKAFERDSINPISAYEEINSSLNSWNAS